MNHWEELRRELQGSRGFAAWVRRQVIPQGAQLADEARQQVLRNLWKDIPPSRDEILRNVNTLFCDFLDTEYVLYLQYEEQCALMAIELALSEHAQRHYPKTSQLIRSTLSV